MNLMNLGLQVKGPDWSKNDRSTFSVSGMPWWDEMPLAGMSSPSLTLRMFKQVLDPLLCGWDNPRCPCQPIQILWFLFPQIWFILSSALWEYVFTKCFLIPEIPIDFKGGSNKILFVLKQWWYNGSCVHAKLLSHVQLFVTLWTVAHQASLSMGFSRQEYWSGLPCPPPGDFSQPRDWIYVSCGSCIAGWFFTAEPPGKPLMAAGLG